MDTDMNTVWLTVDEYAQRMRLSRWTVYRRVREGKVPGAQQAGVKRGIRIPAAAAAA